MHERTGGLGPGGGGGTPLYELYGDVPLDRVWFFGLSALNRVYNFKRVCPGSVLDRVWLQDCRLVFGNPKSETLVISLYLF